MTTRNPLPRVLLLLVVATVAAMTLGTPRAHAEDAATYAAGERRATIVVLVDQSGSLSEADFDEQVRAVRTLKNLPDIDLYVYGFASAGTLPAVKQVCVPESDLDKCADDLQRRTDGEGNDTDHASALGSAAVLFENLGSSAAEPGIVLLMTDGRFDPDGTGTPSAADNDRVSDAMQKLSDLKVQVWPLGFGDADIQELDRIADASFAGTCDGGVSPESVIVSDVNQVPSGVNKIIGSATCAPADLDVPPGTQTLVVTYAEDELDDPATITATNEQGDAVTTHCTFDDLSRQWVCEIPTDELGPGKWEIDPAPLAFPFPFPIPGPVVPSPPPDPSPTTTIPTDASTSTTVSAVVLVPVDEVPNESSGGFPWIPAVLGALGLGLLAWALLKDRSKLTRGVVAVRAAGHSDWSPEQTVLSEKRQGFEVDPDSGYPSIETTSMPAPDVVLEATRKGLFVSGSMIDRRRPIRLGDEIELIDGMTFTYVGGFDHDSGPDSDFDIDEDLNDDTFV